MLLSKLELNGFKSFPSRIELKFDEGIMGVVGPNGCGKTNILDSIRWVLGEQRTSLLRAGKTEEVIFNGTSQLKASDMAEVSLTLKNNRGVLPLEYDEVEITRRLFRSGESEYFLNRSRCRLKDITNLFADTGMGIHAYSIFQQGMVDAVLSDKAEERRFLFEEAAGITKYKYRKKEALKKLENTETDLIRLSDIIAEISKNVRSLRRQAGRARRYKSLKEQLQYLEITRASAKIYDLREKINGHESETSRLKAEKTSESSRQDSQEAEIQELKLQIDSLNERISAQAARETDFSQQALKAENDLAAIQARLESGAKNIEIWSAEIDSLRKRIESLTLEKSQSAERRSQTVDDLEDLNAFISEGESGVVSAKDKLDKSAEGLELAREKLHRCENELSTNKARLEAAHDSLERLNDFNRGLDQSLSKYQKQKKLSEQNLELQKNSLLQCEDAVVSLDRDIQTNQHRHIRLNGEIEEIKKQISNAIAEKSGTEARIEVLSRMVIEHEGYGSGVKTIFGWESKPDGIIDTLANLITADKRYHLAVEAALGSYGQLVVCRKRDDAIRAIDFLEQNSAGRVGFLMLDSMPSEKPAVIYNSNESYRGTVTDLIECQEYLRPAVDRLFGSIRAFDEGGIPEGCEYEAVDLSGRRVSHSGIMEGGKTSTTLVGRKSDLADLQDLLDEIKSKTEMLNTGLEDKQGQLKKSADEADRLINEKTTLLKKRETLLSEMTRLEFEFKESVTRLSELEQNSTESGKHTEALQTEKSELEELLAVRENERLAIVAELEKLNLSHKALEQEYEQAVASLNRQRLRMVELNGLLHKLDDDIVRFDEMIEEAGKMIDQKNEMISQENNGRKEMESRREVVKSQISKLFQARDRVTDEKSESNNQRNELMAKLNELETGLKALRTDINNLSEKIHHQELKFAEYENSIQNISEQAYHEYGIRISPSKADAYDESQIEGEIDRWKRVLEKIGQVNMLADEEYTTEKGRLDFLEKQYADLQEAKKNLLEVIHKINKTAEEKFADTFDIIKENFQSVFESLFEGGTAEIRLENPDDLLDSPVDIIARPGGKKLVSVNQLSGGEKALTAISLLFAIYMVKASPFCILDEIDAPLDDANVTRFLKLINKFTHSTQFIVITHNKKTMEAADLLYGVTMEKPGVSNIVSVKFNGNMVENVQQV